MSPRRLVMAVAVWLLTVISIAGVAGAAIDSAGRQVGVLTTASRSGPDPDPGRADTGPGSTASTSPAPARIQIAAETGDAPGSTPPARQPAAYPEPSAARTPAPASTARSTTVTEWTRLQPEWVIQVSRGSISVAAITPGEVMLTCSPSLIADWRAVAADGWQLGEDVIGPTEMVFRFSRRGTSSAMLWARCSDGVARFDAASRDPALAPVLPAATGARERMTPERSWQA